ncbi:universal stress protein [Streptomyces sp. V4-01]|uniref:Universal stress protein n=1 Tax=Actinacidiphila polyblastidii TaxID=3110430 RepID=A0ABU7PD99_9ACTN|nr:universal stress protein [Streptomyces sp. V4-01]
MRRTVIAAVDGSSASMAAAEWAAGEALHRGTSLHLLNAVAPRPGSSSLVAPTDPHTRPKNPGWSPFEAADDLGRAHPGLRVTADQVAGQTLPVLFGAADRADLLVLGSHGTGAVSGFLLGSVALTVVGQSPVPVILVRAGHQAAGEHRPDDRHRATTGTPFLDVVLGLDLVRPSERLIEFGFEAAARRAATLRVVHGWNAQVPYGFGDGEPDDGSGNRLATQVTGALAAILEPWRSKFPHTDVVGETMVGRADRHLLDAASQASLLVIGRRPRASRVAAHIGATSHSVLHRALTPVAVVPHE